MAIDRSNVKGGDESKVEIDGNSVTPRLNHDDVSQCLYTMGHDHVPSAFKKDVCEDETIDEQRLHNRRRFAFRIDLLQLLEIDASQLAIAVEPVVDRRG